MKELTKTSRRDFLKTSGIVGGGLIVGFNLYSCKQEEKIIDTGNDPEEINAFIWINGDGTATLMAKNPEIGQGVRTSLPMILAEELDMPWEKIKVEPAKLDSRLGPQYAGGSTGVTTNYESLRKAGAAVRSVLVLAAANKWGVSPEQCKTENGFIINGKEKFHYGEVALEAAELELPEEPMLKEPKDFSVIGVSKPDVDIKKIVTGQSLFGLDQEVEGMVYASIIKPDVFLSKVVSFDAEEAKKLPGVLDVVKIEGMSSPTALLDGVAVIANSTWTAFQAKKLVRVEWERPSNYVHSMEKLNEELSKAATKGSMVLRKDGNVEEEFNKNSETLEATYTVPFISHSQMEPMNFIANVMEDKVELIGPTQTPGGARYFASAITGIDQENISVEFTRIGGGFGRRLLNDYSAEATYLSHKLKKPVKVVWQREDDFLGDYYRPAGCYHMKASLDGTTVSAFQAKIATTSRRLFAGSPDSPHVTEAFPDQEPAGMVPNLKVTYEAVKTNVPVGALRTPGVNATTFAYQCFLDELAEKAGMDPIDFQMQMIGSENKDMKYDDHGGPTYNTGKLKKVIELVREKSNWDTKPAEGIYRGFAGQMVFGTYVAAVVEVSKTNNNKIKVNKVTISVDCGLVVNPVGAEAQIQGGITDALSAALYEEISFDEGKLVERNFNTYRKLLMKASPDVDVHFVENYDHPKGLGEPSYPILFPALCNAVYAATGTRVRELPLKKHGLV